MQIPALCPSCGLVFESGIDIGPYGDAMVEGVGSVCPRCDAIAELIDGTYQTFGDTMRLLAAPTVTRERLQEVASIIALARDGSLTPEDAVKRAVDVVPEVAPIAQRFDPRTQQILLFFLEIIISTLLTYFIGQALDDSASSEDVQRAIERALEEGRGEH